MPLISMLVDNLLTLVAIAMLVTAGVMLFYHATKYDDDHPKDE